MITDDSHKIDTSRVQRIYNTKLVIPIGAEVIIHAVGLEKRFKTSFIGLIKDEYILVYLPHQQQHINLAPNDLLAIRYLVGSLVYGFSSTVAAIIGKPFPILFINHPESFESLSLRQDDRVQCFQQITIFKDEQEHLGKLTDLSKSGCRIIMDPPGKESSFPKLNPQDEIVCMFQLPDNEENLYTKGRVRFSKPHKNKVRLGIQFIDLEESVQDAIEEYVAATLEYMD